MKMKLKSEKDLPEVVREVLKIISEKESEKACVVALSGDLGAGKTTFTKKLAHKIGVEEHVASPTFVIERVYDIDFEGYKHFIHIDAYRMENGEELIHLGWEEQIKDPDNLIFIEWPEKVSTVIPENVVRVNFEHGDREEERVITIQNG